MAGESQTAQTPRRGWHEKFLAALAEKGAVAPAAKAAGVGRATVYEHRKTDHAFSQRIDEILDACVEEVEGTLYERAAAGATDTAVIFFLKTRKPAVYGDHLRFEEREQIRKEAREEALAEMRAQIRDLPPALRRKLMAVPDADAA